MGSGCSQSPDSSKQGPGNFQTSSIERQKLGQQTVEDSLAVVESSFYDLEVDELKSVVSDLFARQEWKKARKAIMVLLEDDPESLDYHFMAGRVCFEAGDFPEAMDEFRFLQSPGSGLDKKRLKQAQSYLSYGQKRAVTLVDEIQKETVASRMSEKIYEILKLNPDVDFKAARGPKGQSGRSRSFYIVSALKYFNDLLREQKGFWTYYKLGFLHFQMHWYEDTLEEIDKALTLADNQEQVFMALRLQAEAQKKAPEGDGNALDKLAALDLTEDMLEEFLSQYARDLTQAQIHKIREVMNTGMRLKERLDSVETDQEKLDLLQEFQNLSQNMLEGESFPPEVQAKVEKGSKRASKLFDRFREQIRIKQEALKE